MQNNEALNRKPVSEDIQEEVHPAAKYSSEEIDAAGTELDQLSEKYLWKGYEATEEQKASARWLIIEKTKSAKNPENVISYVMPDTPIEVVERVMELHAILGAGRLELKLAE